MQPAQGSLLSAFCSDLRRIGHLIQVAFQLWKDHTGIFERYKENLRKSFLGNLKDSSCVLEGMGLVGFEPTVFVYLVKSQILSASKEQTRKVVHQTGYDPVTYGLENRCSVQLSYWCIEICSLRYKYYYMKTCKLCQSEFPNWIKIDGVKKNLQRRKYCLKCSPFNSNNTIKLECKTNENCLICNSKLNFNQKTFCCRECKIKSNSKSVYPCSKKRRYKRKMDLVLLRGGSCESCGYSKNLSALEFHHIIPSNKKFMLNNSCLSNRTYEECLKEAEKCLLLCSNCHREHHRPDLNNWKD